MIGSACLVCGEEIKEFELFRIVDNGVIHSAPCHTSSQAGEATKHSTSAASLVKEQDNGE